MFHLILKVILFFIRVHILKSIMIGRYLIEISAFWLVKKFTIIKSYKLVCVIWFMTRFTEHVAFQSHQDFFLSIVCLLSDAYSLPKWDRCPGDKYIYKIYIKARIQAISVTWKCENGQIWVKKWSFLYLENFLENVSW